MAVKRNVPDFRNEEEARDFFDKESSVNVLEDTEPEQLLVDPTLVEKLRQRRETRQMVTLRISSPHLEGVRRIARHKGIPYQTLIQLWIAEALERECREN